ncbi:DUF2919 domain-containing protein [Thalassotalea litorea]|uniref:DUF2919 domain-containing protein n=1 Tax=Thalassotalea litorea TaxID=2020715 RepID=A0A5R9IVT6_9GAMM|nr:DUF2919 family protein [Thalassotalea litorea]TLU67491.1 DUF2919 domain-containing protein [Thalassotalea litorea]
MDKKVVHPYAKYSLKDFDRNQCLKLSWWFYLVMIYLNRAYLVGLLSVVNMRDKLQFIQMIYPQPETFYVALVVSIPSLLFVYVVFFRKPDASRLVHYLWPNMIWLAFVILVIEALLFSVYSIIWQGNISAEVYLQWFIALIVIACGMWLPRVRLNLAEFPEQVEEKSGRSKKPPN